MATLTRTMPSFTTTTVTLLIRLSSQSLMAKVWHTLSTWDLSFHAKSRNLDKSLSYVVFSHERWHLHGQSDNMSIEEQESVWRAQESLSLGVCAGNDADEMRSAQSDGASLRLATGGAEGNI
jgi:hypothetical protein